MTSEETLQAALVEALASADFSEAVLTFEDGSRLCFCHRVGQRWAKAVGTDGREAEPGLAGELLADIVMFRLNAKHLDVQFNDGSRWDEAVARCDSPPGPSC